MGSSIHCKMDTSYHAAYALHIEYESLLPQGLNSLIDKFVYR